MESSIPKHLISVNIIYSLKCYSLKTFLLICFTCLSSFRVIYLHSEKEEKQETIANEAIDYSSFKNIVNDVESIRSKRRVSLDTFLKYAKEENTIILDTRSKAGFDKAHIKGSIHLSFSDFTEDKLAEVIPSKNTRILI